MFNEYSRRKQDLKSMRLTTKHRYAPQQKIDAEHIDSIGYSGNK